MYKIGCYIFPQNNFKGFHNPHLLPVLEVREGDNHRPAMRKLLKNKLSCIKMWETKEELVQLSNEKTTCIPPPLDRCASWKPLGFKCDQCGKVILRTISLFDIKSLKGIPVNATSLLMLKFVRSTVRTWNHFETTNISSV